MGAINRLFAKLFARYGNQWANQWDDERVLKMAKNEWYEELKHLSLMDIKKGLDNYKGEFPPNLIQFYNACTEKPVGHPSPAYRMWKSESDNPLMIEDKDRKEKREKYMKEKGNAYIERIRRENGWIK